MAVNFTTADRIGGIGGYIGGIPALLGGMNGTGLLGTQAAQIRILQELCRK